jgi:hypothetical protein
VRSCSQANVPARFRSLWHCRQAGAPARLLLWERRETQLAIIALHSHGTSGGPRREVSCHSVPGPRSPRSARLSPAKCGPAARRTFLPISEASGTAVRPVRQLVCCCGNAKNRCWLSSRSTYMARLEGRSVDLPPTGPALPAGSSRHLRVDGKRADRPPRGWNLTVGGQASGRGAGTVREWQPEATRRAWLPHGEWRPSAGSPIGWNFTVGACGASLLRPLFPAAWTFTSSNFTSSGPHAEVRPAKRCCRNLQPERQYALPSTTLSV